MKQLTCEICGSTDLIKQDGLFVCQSCGTKYSVEEAKNMMGAGAVDAGNNTAKADTSGELANLYQIARRAKSDENAENAAKYYDMVLIKDPTSWEASFYVVYYKAMQCKIAQIQSAGNSVANCIDTVLRLIRDHVSDKKEQNLACAEVVLRVRLISSMLFNAAKNHYDGIDSQIRLNYRQEWLNNAFAAMRCVYQLGDSLDALFGTDTDANRMSVAAWKQGVEWHQSMIRYLSDKDSNRSIVNGYISKIKKYDSSYTAPEESKGACYVATAVYGSYDCPQVWTLRRFRDHTLAKTWYGRAFIRTYYAISPTLVKWFGHTEWFKRIWKGKLDRIVANLNTRGIEDTPYEDKGW